MTDNNNNTSTQNHKRLIIKLVIGVVFMFGFAYMLVPLYTLVCKQVGINGRSSNTADAVPTGMQVDNSRTVKVVFSTMVHGRLGFEFKPQTHDVHIHPGETKMVYFYAHNESGHGITVQAIPSITPDEAAKYLKKTQCFCFTQQYFFDNEKADMPVYFYVDPHLPKQVKEITLSYTLFDATPFEKKQEHFTKGRVELQ